jgi:NADH-quinone oxidoreductase subunit L
MVTAGVFMVVRMSPLFEYSEAALSVVLVVGATTALFTGLLGIAQNDIKRIIAYSTLSQLGYMTVALGSSAYAAGIFHLMTHAFFKALLFLAAGSVILALHHEQDIRKMGGLKRYLPITYWTCLAGALALIGFPGTAGFFSKDALIEAVGHSTTAGAGYAFICVVAGVFVTGLYTFRMFFLVFHGQERVDEDARQNLHESPWVVTLPLILLAIPSLFIGWPTIGPVLFGDYFGSSLTILQQHDVLRELGTDFHGALGFVEHGLMSPVVYLAAAGVFVAWYLYLRNPAIVPALQRRFSHLYQLLLNKYYFDEINDKVFARGSLAIGNIFWRVGDVVVIDGAFVNGSARFIGWVSEALSRIQTGYLYRYAFAMVIGLCALTGWILLGA